MPDTARLLAMEVGMCSVLRWSGVVRARLCLSVLVVLCVTARSLAQGPAWWTSRGVVETNTIVMDYAPAIQAQLKWIATNAADELEEGLPGGAGSNVWNLVAGFPAASNDIAVNIGQLKATAKPFYDRLNEADYYTNSHYPWTEATTNDDADFALANIGQLKLVFSFDPGMDGDADGMKDWWEGLYFGATNAQAGEGDYDADGLSNAGEYWQGACPTNTDSDADGTSDGDEVAIGSDPADAMSYPAAIGGVVVYTGLQTGDFWVVAVTASDSWSTNRSQRLSSVGSYAIANIPNQTNYWVNAYRDSNGNGTKDCWEAHGTAEGSPYYLTTNLNSVVVTLSDPDQDTDADGLPDWWETGWFGGVTNQSGAQDYDADALSNSNEYWYGSCPTNSDTDGDALSDHEECVNLKTDPNNSDTNRPMVFLISPPNGSTSVVMP